MKRSTLLAVSASLLLPVSASRLELGGGEDKAKVCYPAIKSGVAAPCVEIINIESACHSNGTDSADYEAHAQCMCNGSFFSDWRGCQRCLLVHGLRSERDNVYWDRVLSVASNALCTGMPTAEFWSVFASAASNTVDAPFVTIGDTKSFDGFPGQTDVSIYYTASGTQGPGAVTGAVASTVKQQQTSGAVNSPGGVSTGGNGGNGGNTTAITSTPSIGATMMPASTSRTLKGAAPTDGTGSGLAMAVAGAALIMAF
ncbi:Uncharacterized protein TCAP_03825 [Tolypocladium capitatum]|uniref:Collagen-like protein Mcl1 n=1 Tax=Tolypocladium capitatum TaxID=45235 RepID=A0A2K3QFD1_9HYPO|nr:Uncharacterized protein TCAP_03825 [Tolypocladium capitatum]